MSKRTSLLLVGLFLSVGQLVGADEPLTAPSNWSEIVKSWTDRAGTEHPMKVIYTAKVFTAGRMRGSLLLGTPGGKQPFANIHPPEDLTVTSHGTLLFHGTRWRQDTEGKTWSATFDKIVNTQEKQAFDGRCWTGYHVIDEEPSHRSRPGWVETKASADMRAQLPQLIPWMLVLNPFDVSSSAISPSEWFPSGDLTTVTIDDCEMLRQELQSTKLGESELLIDPTTDLRVRRFTRGSKSRGFITIEISYAQHEGYGWYPSHYRCTTTKPENTGVDFEFDCDVNSIEFDAKIDDADFSLSFPPGTVVRDTETNSRNPITYFVKRDGSPRMITREEWVAGLRYDELEEADAGTLVVPVPVQQPVRQFISTLRFAAVISCALLTALLMTIWWLTKPRLRTWL